MSRRTGGARLCTSDGKPSNFWEHEFQSHSGYCFAPQVLVDVLQKMRNYVRDATGREHRVIITDGGRTYGDNVELAERLGWIDDGGPVSKYSKHLFTEGSCAVDFYLVSTDGIVMPAEEVKKLVGPVFDFFQTYPDGHCHGDMRDHVTV